MGRAELRLGTYRRRLRSSNLGELVVDKTQDFGYISEHANPRFAIPPGECINLALSLGTTTELGYQVHGMAPGPTLICSDSFNLMRTYSKFLKKLSCRCTDRWFPTVYSPAWQGIIPCPSIPNEQNFSISDDNSRSSRPSWHVINLS